PDPVVEFWSGPRRSISRGATLVHCGGHFAGGSVLHWADGAERRGALLTGDILQVAADRASVSFIQLSKHDSVVEQARRIGGLRARTVLLRQNLRCLLGSAHRERRAGGCGAFASALCCGNRGRLSAKIASSRPHETEARGESS